MDSIQQALASDLPEPEKAQILADFQATLNSAYYALRNNPDDSNLQDLLNAKICEASQVLELLLQLQEFGGGLRIPWERFGDEDVGKDDAKVEERQESNVGQDVEMELGHIETSAASDGTNAQGQENLELELVAESFLLDLNSIANDIGYFFGMEFFGPESFIRLLTLIIKNPHSGNHFFLSIAFEVLLVNLATQVFAFQDPDACRQLLEVCWSFLVKRSSETLLETFWTYFESFSENQQPNPPFLTMQVIHFAVPKLKSTLLNKNIVKFLKWSLNDDFEEVSSKKEKIELMFSLDIIEILKFQLEEKQRNKVHHTFELDILKELYPFCSEDQKEAFFSSGWFDACIQYFLLKREFKVAFRFMTLVMKTDSERRRALSAKRFKVSSNLVHRILPQEDDEEEEEEEDDDEDSDEQDDQKNVTLEDFKLIKVMDLPIIIVSTYYLDYPTALFFAHLCFKDDDWVSKVSYHRRVFSFLREGLHREPTLKVMSEQLLWDLLVNQSPDGQKPCRKLISRVCSPEVVAQYEHILSAFWRRQREIGAVVAETITYLPMPLVDIISYYAAYDDDAPT